MSEASEQTTLTSAQEQAIRDACDILQTEGNQLAGFLRDGIKASLSLRLDNLESLPDGIPHRVTIAIHREMKRVRNIAAQLESLLSRTQEDEPD